MSLILPDPCEKCDQWDDADFRRRCSEREKQVPMTEATCGLLARYLGQQEGYAKGAYEAFRFAEDWCHEGCQFYPRYGFDRSGVGTTAFLADYEKWLTSRGIERKGE